jgi:hypothetical protein
MVGNLIALSLSIAIADPAASRQATVGRNRFIAPLSYGWRNALQSIAPWSLRPISLPPRPSEFR